MRYLVTYVENGVHRAWYSNWFDVDNNLNEDIGMIVYDLINHKMIVNSLGWTDIKFDHL